VGLLAALQTTFETIEAALERYLAFLTDCDAASRLHRSRFGRHMNEPPRARKSTQVQPIADDEAERPPQPELAPRVPALRAHLVRL